MNMPLYGLVLAGGESSRMEQEKSEIPYHGVPQVRFCVELLSEFCEKVYLSCRKDKIPSDGTSYFLDDNPGEGPAGGLKTAFRRHPDVAWLVLACDMPGADRAAVRYLVDRRDPEREATAFGNPLQPEPFFAIWEPRLTNRQDFLHESPSAALRASDCEWVASPSPEWLTSVNTPRELACWMASRKAVSDRLL
jgi:molybdenum cofactor guanylyltransferase